MIKLSQTIQDLPHSPTLWANELVFSKRSRNETVFHMGFGESPFPVPERLQQALAAAAHRKEYLQAAGLDELIQAVREYYRPVLGSKYVDQCDVLVAPGSKLTLYALQMAVDGDLLMPVPSWVSYAPQARMLHTDVVKVPTTLDDQGYHIDARVLQCTIQDARRNGLNPTKIILNAPNNPTGLIIPESDLADIAAVCEQEDVLIISDEIYGFVSFDGHYRSVAPVAPTITAVTTGLSKHLSLGGWRIGVGLIPKAVTGLHDALRCIVSETWSCVSSPVQQACVEAYRRHPDIEAHIQACERIHALINRTISDGLRDLGVIAPRVQGAFYNYPDFAPFREALAANGIQTSRDLQRVLLEQYNLASLPGVDFGADPEVLTLRLSGCDYDGAAALKASVDGATLDRSFIEQYAPRVAEAITVFARFLEEKAGKSQ